MGHLPSAAPEDEAPSDPRPPAGPNLFGDPAPYDDLDPEARRSEWAADLGGAEPPRAGEARGTLFETPAPQEAPQPQPQGDWGESADWPPRSSQDWMNQQGQTGWGLASGGASWVGSGPVPGQPGPAEPHAEQGQRPEPHAAPYAAPASGPGLAGPDPQAGGLEFPELRADPYEADVYGQTQYRGDSGGQDLYQSDPYQAERLAAEAQAAREAYQAEQQQYQADPFPAATQGAFPEQPRFPEQPQGAFAEQQGGFPEAPASAYGGELFPADAPPSYGEQAAEATVTETVPAQRRSEETAAPEPAPAEAPPVKVAPPTHVGVRYAIYGIGGLITLGLIIGIVLMLGAAPPSEPNQPGDDTEGDATSESPGADEALSAERYTELAAAAGTAEWFAWRYGDASGGADAEEVPAAEGDALATAPLLGDADRSVQGQLGYLTDDAALSGIDHVTAVETTDDLAGLVPRAGGRFSEDGTPELELVEGSTAECIAGLGVELGRPVALARPEQSGEVSAHSVIAFSSGVVATAGISGAQGGTCLLLPDGQVPTDVALTDGNELALVTTWNPASQTGSLVVIAMGDKSGSYSSSWSESYPGLPNPGHFASAQIVGTVALPFSAPTSVDAWSDSSGSLAIERGTVEDAAHRDTVATAGYAVVGDLSASQVAVVDLASTLQGLAAQYYDGAEFAFDAAPGEAIGFEGGVADVAAAEAGPAVATSTGTVHELDRELAETAATEVGANPTCLVVGAQSGQFIATSRGAGTISWVAGGEVAKQLADSRLTDPVCASETPALDVQGYAGSAAVVLVSDFEGQKLHAYLDGQATLPGGAAVGGEGFSYGGAYDVQGKPWGVSVTVDLE
ncbi:hypothetical protein [Glycomyces terrestris]|uniref:Uncharacterized protein n=1 Tax=Glycomyces terrestris TaxID=2493553 RepID=A0A426UTI2_9ACTN|nr:hypothetical protein [Glycomyces terrestris]RRR97295.1 hypothetical protein EIW28_17930 [Glycomyces terrestris]